MIASQWNSSSGDISLRRMQFQYKNLARFRINIREPDLIDPTLSPFSNNKVSSLDPPHPRN